MYRYIYTFLVYVFILSNIINVCLYIFIDMYICIHTQTHIYVPYIHICFGKSLYLTGLLCELIQLI